jgi:hypothetical protein
VVKPIQDSVIGAMLALAGVIGAGYVGKFVGDMIPKVSDDPDTQKAAGQALVAAAATAVAAFTLPPKFVVPIGIGAWLAPATTIVKMANVGFINDGLGAYVQRQRRLAAYAQHFPALNAARDLGAYAQDPNAVVYQQ